MRRLALIAAVAASCGGGGGTAVPDAAPVDAAAAAAVCPPGWSPRRTPPPPAGQPWRLSEAGLYCDIGRLLTAPGLAEYTPAYELWSDGAEKRRWLDLPSGTVIDTSDMDHWQFPVGARVWKEFARGGRRLETRLIERTGPGERDYWMGAFLWDADGREAHLVAAGARDVLGTDHDVPGAEKCKDCHDGERGRFLGVSAIQLSPPARGLTLAQATARGLPSAPPARSSFGVEGPLRETMGYLHANCGHCHHKGGSAWRDAGLTLRLAVAETRPEETAIHQASIGIATEKFENAAVPLRGAPGDPAASALPYRMRSREEVAMPPLATEHLDPRDLELVEAWIRGL